MKPNLFKARIANVIHILRLWQGCRVTWKWAMYEADLTTRQQKFLANLTQTTPGEELQQMAFRSVSAPPY